MTRRWSIGEVTLKATPSAINSIAPKITSKNIPPLIKSITIYITLPLHPSNLLNSKYNLYYLKYAKKKNLIMWTERFKSMIVKALLISGYSCSNS